MKVQKLTLKAGAGSTKISLDDAIKFFGTSAIEAGTLHGQSKHYGHWSIITSYTALAITATCKDIGTTYNVVDEYTLHGNRTISRPRQSGYNLEGYVSIDGVKRSCFTSSILFEIEETKQLIDVAVMHVRTNKTKF